MIDMCAKYYWKTISILYHLENLLNPCRKSIKLHFLLFKTGEWL